MIDAGTGNLTFNANVGSTRALETLVVQDTTGTVTFGGADNSAMNSESAPVTRVNTNDLIDIGAGTTDADEITGGRPAPDGVLANMAHFGIEDPAEVLKVDDAAPGILEGVNAGARSIGITLSGNGVGLSAEELVAPSPLSTPNAVRTSL